MQNIYTMQSQTSSPQWLDSLRRGMLYRHTCLGSVHRSIPLASHRIPVSRPIVLFTCFLAFLGFSLLIPLIDHLETLKEKKKSHLTLAPPWPNTFFPSFYFLSFLFSLFFSLFSHGRPSSPFLIEFNFFNLYFDPHNLPKLHLSPRSSLVHSHEAKPLTYYFNHNLAIKKGFDWLS